jgi:hypothetical protein
VKSFPLRTFWILAAIFIALPIAAGCGDNDDDDDDDGTPPTDDDDAADDDDDDSTEYNADQVYEDCIQWYVDCSEIEEDVAQAFCGIVYDAQYQKQCSINAYGQWLACLIENINCDDWISADAREIIETCNAGLLKDLESCGD